LVCPKPFPSTDLIFATRVSPGRLYMRSFGLDSQAVLPSLTAPALGLPRTMSEVVRAWPQQAATLMSRIRVPAMSNDWLVRFAEDCGKRGDDW
jgi:hypothetical protein